MTYNIWGRPFPLPSKPSRFKKIPGALVKTNADIIGIQEAFTRRARVFERMGEFLYYAKFNKRGIIKTGAGLLTLSKFPISSKKVMAFSKCAGTDCFAKKGVLLTRLTLGPGLSLDVYNTHMNAAGDDSIRELQIRELAEFMSKNSGAEANVLLLGDMNTDPRHPPYRLFSELMDLDDSYKDYIDTLPSPSREQRDGHTNQRVKPGKGKRIDYVFYRSKNLKVLDSKVNMNGPKTRLSDHDGVITTFGSF